MKKLWIVFFGFVTQILFSTNLAAQCSGPITTATVVNVYADYGTSKFNVQPDFPGFCSGFHEDSPTVGQTFSVIADPSIIPFNNPLLTNAQIRDKVARTLAVLQHPQFAPAPLPTNLNDGFYRVVSDVIWNFTDNTGLNSGDTWVGADGNTYAKSNLLTWVNTNVLQPVSALFLMPPVNTVQIMVMINPCADCSSTVTASAGVCNPATNQYTASGQITLTNPPSTGTVTVQIVGGGNQTFTLPQSSPISYSIAGQTADGASHTVNVTIGGVSCGSSTTYNAPSNCTPLVCSSTVTASAGACNPATNQYTVSGQITLTNPPSTGTVTVQIVGGGNQTFTLPQSSPISYSIAGQTADGASHTINVSISGVSCASSTTYNAPSNCIPSVCSSTVTATAGACNPATNQYTASGQITLTNPPSTGTVTVQIVGGGNQTFTLPQSSPISYSIAGQTADGASHTINVTISGVSCASSTTYNAPSNCTPLVCSSTVTATPGACNPATNQYTASGQIDLTNPPSTGTVTVQIVGGGNQTFTLPQSSPISYSIAGQTADGASHTINVSISGVSCASSTAYNAPVSCSTVPCPNPNCVTLKSKKAI